MNTSEVINQDSIVYITSEQLKYANLIFVEHKSLLNENKLLNQQLENYQVKTDMLLQTDSLRLIQIKEMNALYSDQINDLNNSIKKKDRTIKGWQIGGITISVGLLLFLIFK